MCTNAVETYWSCLKRKFKGMLGTRLEMYQAYLDEFMWREHYGSQPRLVFLPIMQHIHEQYPV